MVIADFNCATRLEQNSAHNGYSPIISHSLQVGSELYNGPELWAQKPENTQHLYDGIKADVFAAATTLFMLSIRMPPFRSARPTDPYYKRLAHKDKKYFWKIFEGFKIDTYFKDLFEKMTCLDPSQRISLDQVLQGKFL